MPKFDNWKFQKRTSGSGIRDGSQDKNYKTSQDKTFFKNRWNLVFRTFKILGFEMSKTRNSSIRKVQEFLNKNLGQESLNLQSLLAYRSKTKIWTDFLENYFFFLLSILLGILDKNKKTIRGQTFPPSNK